MTARTDFPIAEVSQLPASSGIYAIVRKESGARYVGQAVNIRSRIATHIKDLDAGKERTNSDMLLQCAWDEFGREAFLVRILESIVNNRAETHYHVRPDNLALAEHYYINDRSEYNKDKRIVRDEFLGLINRRAWREPVDPETLAKFLTVIPGPYLVAKRKTWQPGVIVLAFNHVDAKVRAAALSPIIAALGGNLMAKRLSSHKIQRLLNERAATDLRANT
jgi:hypothetical protein